MKQLTLFAFLLLLPVCAAAQLTNEGFEEWKVEGGQEQPAGWTGSSAGVGRDAAPYSGSNAVSVWNWYFYGLGYVAIGDKAPLSFDLKHSGVPIDFVPTTLTGYYKYELGQNSMVGEKIDSAAAYVMVKRYNPELQDVDTIAFAVGLLPPSHEWVPFSVELPVRLPGVQPDSVVVVFYSSNPENGAFCGPDSNVCCYLSVDDISLNTTSGVRYNLDRLLSPARVVPNPVYRAARIEFPGQEGEAYRIRAFDAAGTEVYTAEFTGPLHTLAGRALSPGVYYFSITDAENRPRATGEFVVE